MKKFSLINFDCLTTAESDLKDAAAVAKIVQSIVLPFYKTPMPQYASYREIEGGASISLGGGSLDWEYKMHLDRIHNKEKPARIHHGAMHAARVVLWTQILIPVYEILGREKNQKPLAFSVSRRST